MSHPFIRLVDSPGDRLCHVCGLGATGTLETADGPMPGARRFVELRVQGGEAIPAGRIHSTRDEDGQTVVMVRNPVTPEPAPIYQQHELLCSDCAAVIASLFGLGDLTLVELDRDRAIERAEDAERTVAERDQEIEQLVEGARVAGALSRILDAERSDKPSTRKAASRASS